MKRYIIVGSGQNDFAKVYQKRQGDIIVGCDGGYRHILEMGIKTDIWVGDYDSLSMISVLSSEKYSFNPIKDQSDLELAIDICLKKQEENSEVVPIVIYNATGGRIDHFIAALRILETYRKENIQIIDAHNLIYIKNSDFEIKRNGYKYISFYNIEKATYISLKNFKYELTDYYMKDNDYLCLSNKINRAQIGIVKTNNSLIVIQSND